MTIGAKLAMAKEDIPARSTAPAMRSGPRSTMNHLECPRDAGWTSREAATAVPKSGQTRRSHRLCILVMHFCRCDLVSLVCNPRAGDGNRTRVLSLGSCQRRIYAY